MWTVIYLLQKIDIGAVWIEIILVFAFVFLIFFFTRSTWTQLPVGLVHCARDPHHFQCPHIGLTMTLLVGLVYCLRDPQISLFNNFFIKNGSHDTIYTFKNYFITVFLDFSFSNNKFNLNGRIESVGDALKVGF